MWNIIKRRVYQNRRQFTSKDELCHRIEDASRAIASDKIQKFASSMDQLFLHVISRKTHPSLTKQLI